MDENRLGDKQHQITRGDNYNNHPDVGLSYNNITTVYKEKGDYVKALEYYNKAPTIT